MQQRTNPEYQSYSKHHNRQHTSDRHLLSFFYYLIIFQVLSQKRTENLANSFVIPSERSKIHCSSIFHRACESKLCFITKP